MTRIVVSRRLPGPALEMLAAAGEVVVNPRDRALSREELLALVRDAAALVAMLTDTIDAEVMAAAGPSLRVISNYAVGFNNVDVEQATRRGIAVTNTPGVLTEATADFTWALLLGVCRRVAEADAFLRRGEPWQWAPEFMLGAEVSGKTLGIVGLGRIGQAVARRAHGFNMAIVHATRTAPDPIQEAALGARAMALDDLLEQADIVSLHVPYTPQTHHLIGARELRRMKPGAYLINTARGPIVDEAALVAALRDGVIAGAGLDVYEHEPALSPGLSALPNVVLAPHLASATVETRTRMATIAADNVLAALQGRRPAHLVNPAVSP